MPLAGYALAIVLHGTWNGIAIRADEQHRLGLLMFGYVAIMVPIFLSALALAIWYRRREGRVLGRRLPAFAEAGWIAPHEVAVLASLKLRELGLDVAKNLGGRDARQATEAYQRQVIGLGFLRERLASGHRIAEGLVQQDQLLAGLPALRSTAVVLPPPAPVLAPGPYHGYPGWPPPSYNRPYGPGSSVTGPYGSVGSRHVPYGNGPYGNGPYGSGTYGR